MKKRRWIVAVAGAALLIFIFPCAKPAVNSQIALQRIQQLGRPSNDQAMQALIAMGSDAVPVLN